MLDLKIELFGREHSSTSTTIAWLGAIARHRENYPEAERLYREAIRIAENTLPPGHSNWVGQVHELGSLLVSQDRWEEAEQMYLLSYERALAHYGPEHLYTEFARRPIAGFYDAWDKPELAAQYRDRAVEE